MMMRLVAWSTRHRRLVIVAALALAVLGEVARRALARDVIPDLSDPQIVLVADWMGHPALEVADKITRVLTTVLDGVPGATNVRGTSMPGMAYVDVVFAGSAGLGSAGRLAAARAEIVARVEKARSQLPATARLQIGPLASSTGWVYQYALVNPVRRSSLLDMRQFQDNVLQPALAAIPGVAEVAALGGATRQLSVEVSPDLLRQRGLAFSDVLSALRAALAGGQPPPTLAQIQALPIAPPPPQAPAPTSGASARLDQVAYARITRDLPSGLGDLGGTFRAVGGIVIAERGADVAAVIARVRQTLDARRHLLPAGVQLVKVYDRSDLVKRVDATLLKALAEEVAAVVLVILLFLLHGRSAIVPLVTLPVVMLTTFAAMWLFDVPASLMSLGGMGIALGIAVDADVVALEACHRRLATLGDSGSAEERRAQMLAAAASFTPAIVSSLLITGLTFLPVFAFTGETGRLLGPLALTKTLVIGSAALLTLTLAPALRAVVLGGRARPELDNPLTRGLVRLYRPFVHFALGRPLLTLSTAALAVLSCLPLLPRLGREFLPRIDEGDLLFMPTTLPGVPPAEAQNQLHGQDRAIASFAEVATVFGKIGRADSATDPAPYSMAETTIRLRPRAEWPLQPRARWYSSWAPPGVRQLLGLLWPERAPSTTAELVERLDQATKLPGWVNAWTAPARARMDMMTTGFRTPVGVRIVAETPARLDALGAVVREVVLRAPGARSAVFESLGGERRLEFEVDPAALARHGVEPAVARQTADLLLTGGQIGEHPEDGKLLRVRILSGALDSMRGAPDQLRDVTVRAGPGGAGQPVPLGLLGRPVYLQPPEHAAHRARPAGGVRRRRPHRWCRPARLCRAGAGRDRARARPQRAGAGARRAHRMGGAVRAARGGRAAPDLDRAGGRALHACLAVPAVSQPDRGADRAGRGSLRAGRQRLGAVPDRLSPLGAGLDRPAVGPGPGDADRRGDGGLHRRGLSSPRARGQARDPRRHRRRARRGDGAAPAPQADDHHHHGRRAAAAAVGRRRRRRDRSPGRDADDRRPGHQRLPDAGSAARAVHHLAPSPAAARPAQGRFDRGGRRTPAILGANAGRPALSSARLTTGSPAHAAAASPG